MHDLMKYGTLAVAGFAAAAFVGLGAPATEAAESLTAVSWGGAYSTSQREAYYKPFAAEFGVEVLEDEWQGDLAQFRIQMETGTYKWDVIDVNIDTAIIGCEEGFLEPIDYDGLMGGRDRFLPGAALDCAVGTMSWSTVFGYDADVYPDDAVHPQTLEDLFNVEKFPGQRGFWKYNSKINLEWALMVDGVPADDVYDVLGSKDGVRRALDVYTKIKDDVLWWESGSQSMQLLADKEVVITSSWNGRLDAAIKKEGKNFRIVWDHQAMEYDLWVVIKDNPKKDLAMQFIEYSSRPEVMKNQSKYISYGPTTYAAAELIAPEILIDLPTHPHNSKTLFVVNQDFWVEHVEEYNEIWNAWLATL